MSKFYVTNTFLAGETPSGSKVNVNFSDLLLILNNIDTGADTLSNLIISSTNANPLSISSSAATTEISINNTATDGDPITTYKLSGTTILSMGIDDSDSDKFKIGTTDINTAVSLTIPSSGGAVQFAAGSASAPSISFAADTNTGLSNTADVLIFNTAGVSRGAFISDGSFIVTDTPTDLGITSGTAAGSVISGHNRFFRSVTFAHTGTVRLIGIGNSDNIVIGGEPANTPIILDAGSGHVRMDNASQINWRKGDNSADVRVLDMDSGNNINFGRDDAIGDIQVFNQIVGYDDAASPSQKWNISAAGAATFAGAVAIGNTVNSVSPTSPNRTITISVGGSTYYLAAKTTND